MGHFVWAVLSKDSFPLHEYNKLASRKIDPVEIVEKINPNAYRLHLSSHIRTQGRIQDFVLKGVNFPLSKGGEISVLQGW